MDVTFPAMRGTMGGRTYYSTLMQLRLVPKLFSFDEWPDLDPRDREQRKLNTKRIPNVAQYITLNEGEGFLFSSITASYKSGVHYEPGSANGNAGTLRMDLADASFLIDDGQHRAAAIHLALDALPGLGEETISVLLFPYETRARAQRMFSDLNRYVKKTSKSLDILFDKRDPLSDVTLRVADAVPAFKGLVEMEATSLPVNSGMLFTIAALYDANKELLSTSDPEAVSRNDLTAMALEYWTAVTKVIPDWARVRHGEISAKAFRQENISSHSVVLRAIGAVGSDLIEADPDNWKERLQGLKSVNWSKSNREWENVNIIANSVVSNRQARAATKAYLKQKLGLELSEAEHKAIAPPLAQVA